MRTVGHLLLADQSTAHYLELPWNKNVSQVQGPHDIMRQPDPGEAHQWQIIMRHALARSPQSSLNALSPKAYRIYLTITSYDDGQTKCTSFEGKNVHTCYTYMQWHRWVWWYVDRRVCSIVKSVEVLLVLCFTCSMMRLKSTEFHMHFGHVFHEDN